MLFEVEEGGDESGGREMGKGFVWLHLGIRSNFKWNDCLTLIQNLK